MTESSNTVKLHRALKAPAERVYRAFLDSKAKERWLPPYGFLGEVHEHSAEIGGTYRMSFTNFSTGHSHSFGGKYVELIPNRLLRYTDSFDDPNLPGEMQITVNLKEFACGTVLEITQSGIPEAIPAEMCYLGWQESLLQLARLVEPDIPDAP